MTHDERDKRERQCLECRHYKSLDNGLGRCHAHAPNPYQGHYVARFAWPLVGYDDYCGEWEVAQ